MNGMMYLGSASKESRVFRGKGVVVEIVDIDEKNGHILITA